MITYDISLEMSLWALLFIMFLGVIWLTIMDKLKRIEKLLKEKDSKNGRPSKIG